MKTQEITKQLLVENDAIAVMSTRRGLNFLADQQEIDDAIDEAVEEFGKDSDQYVIIYLSDFN